MKLIDTTFCHPTVISFLKISIGIPFQIVHQYLVQKPFLLNSKHIFLYLYNLISKISSQSPLMKNRILFSLSYFLVLPLLMLSSFACRDEAHRDGVVFMFGEGVGHN